MLKIRKFVIGVRPASKMFRVSSLVGEAIDAVLARRGIKPLEDEYYSEVATNIEQGAFQLKSENLVNVLRIDRDNVIFTKDYYNIDKVIDIEAAILEFAAIWSALEDILKIRDIRRIGFVAEHRIYEEKSNASAILMKTLTTIPPPIYPAKFLLRYEERQPTAEGLAPDIKKSDFVNVITDYYDAEVDADHSERDAANANIDVQKYYAPPLSSNVVSEVRKLQKLFNKELERFNKYLASKGITA